jgi:hypothetical protein
MHEARNGLASIQDAFCSAQLQKPQKLNNARIRCQTRVVNNRRDDLITGAPFDTVGLLNVSIALIVRADQRLVTH